MYSRGWYLPVSRRITKALKNKRRCKESTTKELDMIKQHMKCESCTTERGGIPRVESGSTRKNQEVNRDETWSSDSRSSHKTSCGVAENLFQHTQAEARGGHECSCETGQVTELSSYKPSRKISNTTQTEKFRNSVWERFTLTKITEVITIFTPSSPLLNY